MSRPSEHQDCDRPPSKPWKPQAPTQSYVVSARGYSSKRELRARPLQLRASSSMIRARSTTEPGVLARSIMTSSGMPTARAPCSCATSQRPTSDIRLCIRNPTSCQAVPASKCLCTTCMWEQSAALQAMEAMIQTTMAMSPTAILLIEDRQTGTTKTMDRQTVRQTTPVHQDRGTARRAPYAVALSTQMQTALNGTREEAHQVRYAPTVVVLTRRRIAQRTGSPM